MVKRSRRIAAILLIVAMTLMMAASAAAASAPVITSQPGPATVSVGDTVKFTVSAKGTGLTYRWQYSDDGSTWRNCVSETNDARTFTFKAAMSLNGRQYRCAVTGSGGVKVYSSSARLTVTSTRVTGQPGPVTASAGEAVEFTVSAKGTGLTYRWQYSDDGTTWRNCVSETNDARKFTFKAAISLNGRQYRCAVTGSDGVKIYSSPAKLSVTSTRITKNPGAEKVTIGDTAVFTVAAEGTGLKYRWQYSADGGKTWTNMSGDSASTTRLSFTVTSENHGRQYRCAVTGSDGITVYSDIGGETYIDVSLTDQILNYYINGKVSLSTPVITGKPGSPTPTGTYSIRSYSKDTALYPSDGTGPYYVDYWIGWDRSGNVYGFHDAQWKKGPFGGDTYKTDGSHGCINLPLAAMKELYETTTRGIAVYIHY